MDEFHRIIFKQRFRKKKNFRNLKSNENKNPTLYFHLEQ